LIVYYTCACCKKDFCECRELRKGESVVIKNEDRLCEACGHSESDLESFETEREILKQARLSGRQVRDDDDWMNYYSGDYM